MIDGVENEPLELETLAEDGETVVGFADEHGEPESDGEETVIAFADEPEEGEEEVPLVKKLRTQLREAQSRLRHVARQPAANDADADPEPVVPPRKRIEEFDYDQDKADEYAAAREAALLERVKWEQRQGDREAQRKRAQDDQAKQIEQQKRSLGVGDYDQRAEVVKDTLSEAQLAILINGADNPAQMIYALGRHQNKLDMLAGEENLAKFAVMIGKLERDIKVQKRKAPEPESRVRGATASLAVGDDRELARLEKEAERTGDRTKIRQYRKAMQQGRAA